MLKKLCCLLVVLLCTALFTHAQTGTDSAGIARAAFIKSQTVKADSLNDVALKLASNGSAADLSKALDHIMTGLHIYSKFRDSVGLRQTFDNLGLVYHLQKKYTQAKWFILQSNEISREKRDTVNIINSLQTLASVKEDIKDFSLAKRDLDEALAFAKTQPRIDQQVSVQKALAQYYTKKGDATAATLALNRIKFLNDSVASAIANRQHIIAQKIISDSLHHVVPTTVTEEATQQKSIIITIITLITAVLAGVCLLFYQRNKRKK